MASSTILSPRFTPLIHPFAFAVFPVLNLLAHNIAEVNLLVAVRPLLFALLGAVMLLGFARLLLRDWRGAGLVTSFAIFIFISYGHVYTALARVSLGGIIIGRHRYLIGIYALILVAGLWWIVRNTQRLLPYNNLLNIVGLVLVVLPLLQIAGHFAKDALFTFEARQQSRDGENALGLVPPETLPDIYYIILDSHTRSDALQDDFGHDNTPSLDMLSDAGFYVAGCSRSNYSYTLGSLTSALNMDYLPNLRISTPYASDAGGNIWVLLKHSRVRQWLEEMGYKTVAFDTTYDWSRLADADIYLRLGSEAQVLQGVTPFEAMLIKSTGGLILTDSQSRLLRARFEQVNFPYSYYMSSQRFILEQLPTIPSYPGPKFIFAHILLPHPPFIFAPDGSLIDDPRYYDGENALPKDDSYINPGYISQVQFIDQTIVAIVQAIIANSPVPPVIIIQGDHGWSGDNRLEILNAYYLPGISSEEMRLYETITPVNSFRVIFNAYFAADLPLLEDASFDSDNQLAPETSPACLGR